jgi:CRISPR/Cas system CSM-associated protein Csm4 (group 5 of RAMP superfamily)
MKRIEPVKVLQRLRILELKLESEGAYVRANTVYMAIQYVLQTMGDECAREFLRSRQ